MLRIREEQYEELGKVSLKQFADSMVKHIREFFPEQYDALGEPIVRNVIEYGVERAEAHGFENEPDVSMYIDLMLLLGSNFDTDPQLPWAAETLQEEPTPEEPIEDELAENESPEDESIEDESMEDESASEPVGRVEKLYDQAIEYLDRITEEINNNAEDMAYGEFIFNEFVDRFGPRLAQLNGVIQTLAQLSSTPNPTATKPN